MNEIAGYISAALIGISLGLIGGGGSILTVPVLVYLFHLQPLTAVSYSLFVVGSTSFVGALTSYKRKLVHLRVAFLFGISSVITVFFVRRLLIPLIPPKLFTIGNFTATFSFVIMILFAVLMLVASFSMIRQRKFEHHTEPSPKKLLVHGIGIGMVTGFLGAGGGFLLIPALVLLLGLEMKKAVGTSLLIIAINSLTGFLSDAGFYVINWSFLLLVTGIAIIGIFIGGWMSKKISGPGLKTGFGWFVLAMALLILLKEILSQWNV